MSTALIFSHPQVGLCVPSPRDLERLRVIACAASAQHSQQQQGQVLKCGTGRNSAAAAAPTEFRPSAAEQRRWPWGGPLPPLGASPDGVIRWGPDAGPFAPSKEGGTEVRTPPTPTH